MPSISGKTMAWVGIPLLAAGSLAIVNTLSQGLLYEIRTSQANLKTAEASYLDAMNKLKGTMETAAAMNNVGKLQAQATIAAADQMAKATMQAAKDQADGLYRATEESVAAENGMFREFTEPLIVAPTKRIATLNEQSGQLRAEGKTGIDFKTRQALSADERADRIALAQILDQQVETVTQNASKTMGDSLQMFMSGMSQGIGKGLVNFYPSSNDPPPMRRIVIEP